MMGHAREPMARPGLELVQAPPRSAGSIRRGLDGGSRNLARVRPGMARILLAKNLSGSFPRVSYEKPDAKEGGGDWKSQRTHKEDEPPRVSSYGGGVLASMKAKLRWRTLEQVPVYCFKCLAVRLVILIMHTYYFVVFIHDDVNNHARWMLGSWGLCKDSL